MPIVETALQEWTDAAMQAGFSHGGMNPSDHLTKEAGQFILDGSDPEMPHTALIKGYLAARGYALSKTGAYPGDAPEPVHETVWMQRVLDIWLSEVFPKETNECQTAGRFPALLEPPAESTDISSLYKIDRDTAEAMALSAVDAFKAEGQLDPEAEHSTIQLDLPYIGPEPEPYALIITAYFKARAVALAQRLGRDVLESPERWFRQAAANYAQETWDQPPPETD